MKFRKNKKGWVRLVEAFASVLLIGTVLILIVNQQNPKEDRIPGIVSDYEISILRNIELNETLRNSIITASASFPTDVKTQVESLIPPSLLCATALCETNELCNFSGASTGADVYAQKIFITSTLTYYHPKQLKLFCWAKT
ncbi:MAG TPA: hypothetical protein VMC07_01385 [Candidatus Omnitrophota bacterium]|nr:hypothetical protein [Candidatus Omnitrophota bacterium]